MSRNHQRLSLRRWARTRRAVFERDGYRCRTCGRPGRLEAYHEPPLHDGADPYDLEGVRTLCRSCHIERHRPDYIAPDRRRWLVYLRNLWKKRPGLILLLHSFAFPFDLFH